MAFSLKNWMYLAPANMRYLAFLGAKANRGVDRADFMAEFLRSNDWLAQVICSNPNNFDKPDVLHIRALHASGMTPDAISDTVGAQKRRISRLIGGKTYKVVI